MVIVSNVVTPVFALPFTLDLAEIPSEECNEICTPPSGHYALIANGATEIPPSGTTVQLLDPLPYAVINDGSGIDPECSEVGRWHATLGPA